MNNIGGERVGRVKGVEDREYKIGVNIRRAQMFEWGGYIHFFP